MRRPYVPPTASDHQHAQDQLELALARCERFSEIERRHMAMAAVGLALLVPLAMLWGMWTVWPITSWADAWVHGVLGLASTVLLTTSVLWLLGNVRPYQVLTRRGREAMARYVQAFPESAQQVAVWCRSSNGVLRYAHLSTLKNFRKAQERAQLHRNRPPVRDGLTTVLGSILGPGSAL